MIILKNPSEVKSNLANKKNLALIPTMGNLHAGHISLIEKPKIMQVPLSSVFL